MVATCVLLGLAGATRADSTSNDPPTELPPLDISAAPLAADDVTLRPYAIDRGLRSGRAIVTLKDVLGLAPGVLIQDSFGGFEPPRLSIRGSGLQSAPSSRGVQFLLDGFPLTLADGSFNAALIDPQLVDRVEVFRGEAAARLAPAALGGALHLRSARTAASHWPAESGRGTGVSPVNSVRTEFGSFGAARGLLTVAAHPGPLFLTASGSFSRQDGYRDHSAQERAGLFTKISLDGAATVYPDSSGPSSRHGSTSLSLYHVRASYDIPGPLTLSASSAAPRSVTVDVLRDLPRRESDATQLTAHSAWQRSLLLLETGASWLRTNDWFRQLRANGLSDSRSDDLTLAAALTRRFDAAPAEPLVRLGSTVSRGWRELSRFRNDSSQTGPLFGRTGLFATTAAVDLETSFRLRDDLVAAAGVTSLWSQRDISDRLGSAANLSRSLHAHSWQPRAQLLWTPRRELAFFAAAARSVEPPTFDDLLVVTGSYPNLTHRSQALRNQRANSFELGASCTHGAFGWDVTAYHAAWSDEILRLADAQGLPRGAVNASPTRHVGLETAFHWQLLEGPHRLRLTTAATWSWFRFTDDPVFGRNELAGAPPQLGSARLLYEHPRGFFAGSTFDWIAGATPVDHANRMRYGGHALTHVRLGWRAAPRPARAGGSHLIGDTAPKPIRGSARATWTLFIEVKNLFDRTHVASTAGVLDVARNPAATAVFLPGPGRAFTVGFEWRP